MELAELLILLAGSLAVTAFSRWRGLPAPLLVVAVAIGVSFVPGLPPIEIDSEVILTVILPPLLYSASLDVSFQDFRQSVVQIRRLGIFLVIFTALVVGVVAYFLIPDMTLPAAILVGAVVAPPDAVSAAAIGRKLGLPRKVMTVISGESLINDAASLTLVKVFLAIVGGAALTIWDDLGIFGLAIGVGVAVGLVLGIIANYVRMRVKDPVVEIVIGLLLPFVAYIVAEELSGSGVLAVVAAGLYVGFNSPKASYSSRLQERPLWAAIDVALEGFVFALIGLQMKTVVTDVADSSRGLAQSVGVAFVVLAVVIVSRPVFIFVTYYWSRLTRRFLYKRLRRFRKTPGLRFLRGRPEPRMSWQELFVISWTGMRGVVTLAAAVSIPLITTSGKEVPARDTMFLIAFVVTVGTLMLQGLTLPWVIRRLGVQDPGQAHRDALAELALISSSTDEALDYIEKRRDAWAADWGAEAVDRGITILRERLIRQDAVYRATIEEETDAGPADVDQRSVASGATDTGTGIGIGTSDDPGRGVPARLPARGVAAIRRELLQRRRDVVVRERDSGNLDEEVMRHVMLGLDAEELAMDNSALSRTRS